MSTHWDLSALGVAIDLAGCPNRCRHCWLGSHRNGNMSVDDFKWITEQFKNWRDENDKGISELGFFSWWREPDYRNDYRELWELEKQLSSPGRAQRFELLSTWRLARDENYANWAATLPPKVCQITFFGMEKNTDWFMQRKGAFEDQLLATERCLAAGIAPRWQLFISKRSLHELDEFLQLIYKLELHKHCEEIGQKFEFFIGGMSPEGSGYEVENIRIDESDLNFIPQELINISRDGIGLLGKPEHQLLEELYENASPPNMSANMFSVSVNADFDVYPNIAEPTEWWRLGNIKTDGVDKIIKSYRDQTTPGMVANRTIPICELAKKYGNPTSTKLYDKDGLICRFMHQWGLDYMKNKLEDLK